ncbi:structural cement protein Gp24 [Acinetobacter pittii]|uniref:structural cement protein Gp24 n=1 Tax=Acinetobacter pittii TaxID=48296 RepID=UPI00300887D2
MGNSFLYRMPSGIPGDISRKAHSTVEAHIAKGSFGAFGIFGKLTALGFVPLEAADTDVYGLVARSYPTQSALNGIGAAVPQSGIVHDIMRRGYMTVKCNAGTAKTAGKVYVRVATATELKPIGGIEAIADGANTIELKNAMFMHDADAQGNVEISYNI